MHSSLQETYQLIGNGPANPTITPGSIPFEIVSRTDGHRPSRSKEDF